MCLALTYGVVGVSADCRLEAQYCLQQGVEMVPLLMEKGYRPTGWLGLILGARLWYPFYDSAVETDAAFTQQIKLVQREIGERGRAASEGVPPVASREFARASQASPRASSPVLAPAPAQVLGPAPRTPTVAARAPAPSFSPSMLTTPGQTHIANDSTLVQVLLEREQNLLALLLDREEKFRHEMVKPLTNDLSG